MAPWPADMTPLRLSQSAQRPGLELRVGTAPQAVRTAGYDAARGDSSDCALVSDVPETHFTRSADGTSLAYLVSGSGLLDLVFHADSPVAGAPGEAPISDRWDGVGFTSR